IGGNRIRPIETIHVTQKTDKTYHNSSPPLVRVLVPLRGEGSEGTSKWWRSAEARGVWGAVRCGLLGPTGCRLFHFQIEDCANALGPAEAGVWCLLNQGDERSGFPAASGSIRILGLRVLRRGVMKKQAMVGWILVLCLALGFGASTSVGQAVYGSIIGTVTDPQGNAVSGANVTVTSVTKNTTDQTSTNESGNFSVIHLIPDTYRVKVEAPGFKVNDIASVLVQVDTAARVDAQLQVGAVTQTVEVTGEVPQLKTDRADVSIDFNSQSIEQLPLANRNFQSLLLSAPGTQQIGWGHAATENPQGSQQTFVQGQHFSGTGYELDGTDT